ncbi:uncharacterized protein BKA55DRAFT_22652 [Fusarium redolens]|uniref:Uncharacterized protein n=1 Tax=Fusarium redolens TaxID=48865 RepID=A0A9P9KWL0_FUSRE|nr:uncharacterized protein BKA55DRAFT_22652 [Fusarium redolens]KAH7269772.1 hypothetical protein BKA55DRAFT_22652 [Fusarium redolens]
MWTRGTLCVPVARGRGAYLQLTSIVSLFASGADVMSSYPETTTQSCNGILPNRKSIFMSESQIWGYNIVHCLSYCSSAIAYTSILVSRSHVVCWDGGGVTAWWWCVSQ